MPPKTKEGRQKALENLRHGTPSRGGKPKTALQKRLDNLGGSPKVKSAVADLLAILAEDGVQVNETHAVDVHLLGQALVAVNLCAADASRYGMFTESGAARDVTDHYRKWLDLASKLAARLPRKGSGGKTLGALVDEAVKRVQERGVELD